MFFTLKLSLLIILIQATDIIDSKTGLSTEGQTGHVTLADLEAVIGNALGESSIDQSEVTSKSIRGVKRLHQPDQAELNLKEMKFSDSQPSFSQPTSPLNFPVISLFDMDQEMGNPRTNFDSDSFFNPLPVSSSVQVCEQDTGYGIAESNEFRDHSSPAKALSEIHTQTEPPVNLKFDAQTQTEPPVNLSIDSQTQTPTYDLLEMALQIASEDPLFSPVPTRPNSDSTSTRYQPQWPDSTIPSGNYSGEIPQEGEQGLKEGGSFFEGQATSNQPSTSEEIAKEDGPLIIVQYGIDSHTTSVEIIERVSSLKDNEAIVVPYEKFIFEYTSSIKTEKAAIFLDFRYLENENHPKSVEYPLYAILIREQINGRLYIKDLNHNSEINKVLFSSSHRLIFFHAKHLYVRQIQQLS